MCLMLSILFNDQKNSESFSFAPFFQIQEWKVREFALFDESNTAQHSII